MTTQDRPLTTTATPDAPVVEAVGLTKRFGKVQALHGLDLVASSGHVVALLGPNGAGKTTFVRMTATLLQPDSGELRVAGVDVLRQPAEVRRLIGLAGQYAAVEEVMTGRENLEMVARLYGRDRRAARHSASVVLDLMGLTSVADRLVRTYSGGMRRRLDLGASLVGAPRLLMLDEPTAGLDPRSRLELWDAIRALVGSGTDVLLTTQQLDEADRLATQVAIIDQGRLVAQGTPGELKSLVGLDVVEVHARDREDLPRLAGVLESLGSASPHVDLGTQRATVPVGGGTAVIAEMVRAFDQQDVHVEDIALRRPTLDEVFLALTDGDVDGQDREAHAPAAAAS
jgi:ABC-2 type transport system ATP-binding protein